MQTNFCAKALDAFDELFFERVNKLLVKLRADQRSRCVANTDNIGAGPDLSVRKAQFQFDRKREEVTHKYRVIEKVHHYRIDASEVGRLCNRTLHPSLHYHCFADAFL